MAQKRLTTKQIETTLEAKSGNISEAAKALGVSRTTLYRRIQDAPHLAEMLTDSRERLVDIAESALLKQVLKGDTTAIIFALKTQGKTRGYIERLEIDVRYVALVKQIEAEAHKLGIDPAEALNDFYAELSAASRTEDESAD